MRPGGQAAKIIGRHWYPQDPADDQLKVPACRAAVREDLALQHAKPRKEEQVFDHVADIVPDDRRNDAL